MFHTKLHSNNTTIWFANDLTRQNVWYAYIYKESAPVDVIKCLLYGVKVQECLRH